MRGCAGFSKYDWAIYQSRINHANPSNPFNQGLDKKEPWWAMLVFI